MAKLMITHRDFRIAHLCDILFKIVEDDLNPAMSDAERADLLGRIAPVERESEGLGDDDLYADAAAAVEADSDANS